METPNFQRGTIDCISQGKVEDKVKPYKAADKVEKSYKVVDKVKGREILQDQIEPLTGWHSCLQILLLENIFGIFPSQ